VNKPPILDFRHTFVPGRSARTLLLLHGTGGDETSLSPIGRALDSEAALLSPRGKVLENGMPRFFRRLAEGIFDEEDLIRRTHELADFIELASENYHFDRQNLLAVGYSNGANIAASLLLLRPGTLGGRPSCGRWCRSFRKSCPICKARRCSSRRPITTRLHHQTKRAGSRPCFAMQEPI
jgi:phospholipase/carboxylesterase